MPWRLCACADMTFPVPVILKRFLAPDLVFSLGIWLSCAGQPGKPVFAGCCSKLSVLIEHFRCRHGSPFGRAAGGRLMAEPARLGNRRGRSGGTADRVSGRTGTHRSGRPPHHPPTLPIATTVPPRN